MIIGNPITLGGGGIGSGLNIAYGTTPPTDTSKLWVPLTEKPDNVEISGDSLQNAVDAIQTMVAKMSPVVEGATTVTINGKIYIFSGTTIQEYDPATDTIVTKSAQLAESYPYNAVVAIGGKAYIFGGMLKTTGTAHYYGSVNIQEYDPATDTIVTKSAQLAESVYSLSAVAIGDKAYIFGGMHQMYYSSASYTYYDIIQEYDPATDTIVTKDAVLAEKLNSMSTVAIGGKAYIFGGKVNAASSNQHDFIQEYDPTTDTIITKDAVLADTMYGTGAVAINGKAYIFGGRTGAGTNSTYLNIVQEYDPATDTIVTKDAALADTAYCLSVSELDGKAYIFGGSNADVDAIDTIQEYTPKAYLGANHLKVFASVYKSEAHQVVTNIVNGKKEQLKLYMTSAFLGDDDGYAKAQDAYVYDTANSEWQALDGTSMTTDMLAALAELGVT